MDAPDIVNKPKPLVPQVPTKTPSPEEDKVSLIGKGIFDLRNAAPFRNLGSSPLKFDAEMAHSVKGIDDLTIGDRVLVRRGSGNFTYGMITDISKDVVQIAVGKDLLKNIQIETLSENVKKLPASIRVERKLNHEPVSYDETLSYFAPGRHALNNDEWVLVRRSSGKYTYGQIVKIEKNRVLVQVDERAKIIKTDDINKMIKKLPEFTVTVDEKLKSKLKLARLKAGFTIAKVQGNFYNADINELNGNVIIKTDTGQLEIDPIFCEMFDIRKPFRITKTPPKVIPKTPLKEKTEEIKEKDVKLKHLLTTSQKRKRLIANFNTNRESMLFCIRKRMQKMGVVDKDLLKQAEINVNNFYQKYSQFNQDYALDMAKFAVNVIGGKDFKDLKLEGKELEGLKSVNAILYRLAILNDFEVYCFDNGLFEKHPGLSEFIRLRIRLQEKLAISSIITERARTVPYSKQKDVIDTIIKIFSDDVKKVLAEDEEEGAWTFGIPGHFVTIYYKREPAQDPPMLRFSIQQVGLGANITQELLPGEIMVNEFRLGDQLAARETEKGVKTSGFACSQNYVHQILLKEHIPNIVRLKVRGQSDAFVKWLMYRKAGQEIRTAAHDKDNRDAFMQTAVRQKKQDIGNCTMASQNSTDKKQFQDAGFRKPGPDNIYHIYKHFSEEKSLGGLAQIAYPDGVRYFRKLRDGPNKSLREIYQIGWKKHMNLTEKGKKRANERTPPWNRTVQFPFGDETLEVDLKELLGEKQKIILSGKSPGLDVENNKDNMLFFLNGFAPENMGAAILSIEKDKLILTNAGKDDITITYKNGKVRSLSSLKAITLTGSDIVSVNLAPKSDKGFNLVFSP